MKKSSPYIFILTLILSLAAVFSLIIIPTAKIFAQTLVPLTGTGETATEGSGLPGGTSVIPENSSPGATAGANEANANPAGAPQDPTASAKCFTFIPPGVNWDACAAGVINLIMWVVSWILFIAGLIFDASMYFTIHISDLINPSPGNPGIPVVTIGWTIFRDLANIFFIFILLWIAISTILGLNSGKTKELLTHLIVVALLINFSLFITQAVIDASNVVAIHFYNLVPGSYSGAFMDGLKIQTLYDSSALNSSIDVGGRLANAAAGGLVAGPGGALIGLLSTGGNPATMLKIVFMGIFGSILMITAAYVFFTAAILFIIRIVVLMFVMILSPLAFLAYILPSTEHYFDDWKNALIKQSFFAPIYLALSYVVVRTIQSAPFQSVMTVTSGSNGWLNVLTASNQFMPFISIAVNFMLLIGLMLGCILVAKKMEAYGVETATEIGKSARGFVYRQIVRGTYVTAAGGVVGYGAQGVGAVVGRVPGLKAVGDKISGFGKQTMEKAEGIQKKIDINELDKKFKDSAFGATTIGTFIREKTTGGKIFGTGAKFGAEKSVKEAYEEDEKLKSRRFALEKMDLAEESVKRLETANMNKWPEMPNWQNKKYKDAGGNFDQAKFDVDFEKFAERFRPQLSDRPNRKDYANTPEGQKEFDAAEAQYAYEQTPTGKGEFAANTFRYESMLKMQPKRAGYTGPDADKNFAKDQKIFEGKFTKAPDQNSVMYSTPTGKVLYAQDKKIYEDGQGRKAKADKAVESATAAVGYAMNQVAPEEFANMHEERISEMAKYANLKQLKAVAASKNWTVPEIQEMLGPRWASEIQDFKDFSENVIKPYMEALSLLGEAIKAKKLDVDESGNVALEHDDDTQQIVTDPATGKKYAVYNDGSGTRLELPADPKLPSHLKAWARNKMTKEEYELASSISPQLFDNPDLVHVIRWGLTNKEFRTDENMPFDLRDRLTYMKDSKLDRVVEAAHDPDYIPEDSDTTRESAVIAATAAAKAAVRRMKKDAAGNVLKDAAGNPVYLETLEQAQDRAFRRMYAKMTPNDSARNRITTDWATGRAANEIAGARGRNRNSKAVLRLVDKGLVQYWKEKDTEDIVALLETVLGDYLDEEQGRGLISDKNRELLNYLFTDPRCTIPKANAMGALTPELQNIYRKLESDGRAGLNKLSFKSDNWKKGITP